MSDSSPPARSAITASRVIAGVCLAVPFVAMLWVGSYARTSPQFMGIPFFYWYQMAWVLGSAALTSVAYLLLRRGERSAKAAPAVPGGAQGAGTEGGQAR